MQYAPHILHKRIEPTVELDEYGRPTNLGSAASTWQQLCECRCDDDGERTLTDENGNTYLSQYHVVFDRRQDLHNGDTVRCTLGDEVRGQGKIRNIKQTNFTGYGEFWI